MSDPHGPTTSGWKPHPLASLFPLLGGDDLATLAADVEANGLQQPVILYRGKVLDGRNRLTACQKAGVQPRFQEFEGTEDEALALVLSLNLNRRHLTTAQKAALAVRLMPFEEKAAKERQGARTDLHPSGDGSPGGQALDMAGARTGVSRNSVWRASKIAEEAPDVFEAMAAGTVRSLGDAKRLVQLRPERRPQVLDALRSNGGSLQDAIGVPHHWARSGSKFEWYTPPPVLDAARRAMGGPFDLDPASSVEANMTVRAERIFTIENSGLLHDWNARRLWMNPPYGYDDNRVSRLATWVSKLLSEHEAGRVEQAVLLIRASTEARWFAPLWNHPICFVAGKIDFIPGPGVKAARPTIASAIVGVGVDPSAFAREFKTWGRVVLPADDVGLSITGDRDALFEVVERASRPEHDKYLTSHHVMDEVIAWTAFPDDFDVLVDFSAHDATFARKVLAAHPGIAIRQWDIAPRGDVDVVEGDFLATTVEDFADIDNAVVGFNPPFGIQGGLVRAFLDHAARHVAPRYFVVVVPMSFYAFPEGYGATAVKYLGSGSFHLEDGEEFHYPAKLVVLEQGAEDEVPEIAEQRSPVPPLPPSFHISTESDVHDADLVLRRAGSMAGLQSYVRTARGLLYVTPDGTTEVADFSHAVGIDRLARPYASSNPTKGSTGGSRGTGHGWYKIRTPEGWSDDANLRLAKDIVRHPHPVVAFVRRDPDLLNYGAPLSINRAFLDRQILKVVESMEHAPRRVHDAPGQPGERTQ